MLVIDTDVLSIHHLFTKDNRYHDNKRFIDKISVLECSTTIFNLLELCGIMATAGYVKQADLLYTTYTATNEIKLLGPINVAESENHWNEIRETLFQLSDVACV